MPSPDNGAIDSWWNIPAETVATMLQVMGFVKTNITYYQQLNHAAQQWVPHYTVVGGSGQAHEMRLPKLQNPSESDRAKIIWPLKNNGAPHIYAFLIGSVRPHVVRRPRCF